MSKKEEVFQKDIDRKALEINGKRIRFLSPKAYSINKNFSIIILKGKSSAMLAKKKPK